MTLSKSSAIFTSDEQGYKTKINIINCLLRIFSYK